MNELTFGVGIPAPAPGYYPGVPQDIYHAWDACSNSRLGHIRRSPAHLQANVLRGSAETDALRFGSAMHMCVLEPEIFEVRYQAKGQCAAFTGGGKGPRCSSNGKFLMESGQMFCGTHKPEGKVDTVKTLLDPEDYVACHAMRDAVKGKRRASNLIGAAGDFELSIVWHEEVEVMIDGALVDVVLPMKARLDHYSPDLGGGTILDLKSTEDAQEEAFMKTIFKYGYHRQGWLYRRGGRKVGLPVENYTILAMEKSPPFEVGVFRLMEAALDAGENVTMNLMKLYARCRHTNTWPGYPDRVRDITLPDWGWQATDDEANQLEEAWQL